MDTQYEVKSTFVHVRLKTPRSMEVGDGLSDSICLIYHIVFDHVHLTISELKEVTTEQSEPLVKQVTTEQIDLPNDNATAEEEEPSIEEDTADHNEPRSQEQNIGEYGPYRATLSGMPTDQARPQDPTKDQYVLGSMTKVHKNQDITDGYVQNQTML